MNVHEKYLRRCIQLAKNGLGSTYPNPLVGSVIVYRGRIIGEGWHYQAGGPHAEVCAIDSVEDHTQLSEATIYVSLEPCSHFGKTPPCANLIIEKGIKNVVVGATDPNPKVAGQGIQRLRDSGCEVTVGILEDECLDLNKRFFTFQNKNRPFIILKWAQSLDGYMAPHKRTDKAPVWISNTFSQQLSHKLRAKEQSIMIGTQTVLDDNPSLTVRDWTGTQPLRVLIDKTHKISKEARVLDTKANTLIITENEAVSKENNTFTKVKFTEKLPEEILKILANQGIQSLIIEGGATTLQSFINSNLWDEAIVFEGNSTFGDGISKPEFQGIKVSEKNIAGDMLRHYKNPSA